MAEEEDCETYTESECAGHQDRCGWLYSEDEEVWLCVEPFGNIGGFEFNQSCMVLTMIFIIAFMYKEEIMRTKIVKNLLK